MSRIQKLSVKELKNSKCKFAIPRSYQRGYRWRADNEVKKLLKDINESESDYSLQPLILCEKDKENKIYDVVDGQQRLTTILLILGETTQFENFSHDEIDNYYIGEAEAQINKFKTSLRDEEKTVFLNKVNEAFFISYIVDENEDEVRKIFTRVNEGKIPLSSAELLKAWIFTSTADMRVREYWNEMENGLADDGFFYFINPDADSPRYYATRLDYIAELAEIELTGKSKTRREVEARWESDNTYVFDSLAEADIPVVFSKIHSIYRTLRNCYDDIDVYNRLGYLLHCFSSDNDQYRILTELNNQTVNEAKHIPEFEKWSGLRYVDDNEIIKNILLLYNLTFYNSKDSRFNFKYFSVMKKQHQWSLDHIHAKNEKLMREEELEKLEKNLIEKKIIDEKWKCNLENQPFTNQNSIEYQNCLYDLLNGVLRYDKNSGELISLDGNSEFSDLIHGIGNLVLLETNINSEFNNCLFIEKKKKAEEKKLLEGTKAAYELGKREYWLKKEYEDYYQEIKARVATFLHNECKINIYNELYTLSTDKPDYGNVSTLPFEECNAVSLKDVLKKIDIVIPDFQREYAQGRTDAQSSYVRKMFLDEIFNFLEGDNEYLNLDFVYGSVTDKKQLFPFDGQQRLTTLFLVYSCLHSMAGRREDWLTKFTYSNRDSAAEYCKEIAVGRIPDYIDSMNASVIGMNTTVQGILERIRNSTDGQEYKIPRYIDGLEKICFYIPSNISLVPDIYWRMNARGKKLTPLERFKSSFFDKDEKEYSRKFDKVAEQIFLYLRNEDISQNYEDSFQNLISLMFDSFQKILKSDKESKTDFFNPEFVPSSIYVEYKNQKSELEVFLSLLNILSVSDLALISNEYKESCPMYTKQTKESLFIVTENQNEKTHALMFCYLIALAKGKQNKQWMRVCANLIWNSSSVASALKLIFNKLLANALDILSFLADDKNNTLSDILQYKEEYEKAKAIQENKNEISIDIIEKAESTAFADGRIDFLFRNADGKINWDDFIKKRDNFDSWFDENGVKKDYREEIVTAYIKLSPWDEGDCYFDISKNRWRNEVFGKINDENYGAVYRKITNSLLSSSINIEGREGERSYQIRKSILDNPWFIKWMISKHNDFSIFWVGDYYNLTPIFTKPYNRLNIYWDAGGWCNNESSADGTQIIQNKQITEFFRVMHKSVKLDEDFYTIIDSNGQDLKDGQNTVDLEKEDFNNKHLVVFAYYRLGWIKFSYNHKNFYLISHGVIATESEYKTGNIDWESAKDRCIYENQNGDCFAGNLKNENALIDMLDNLVKKSK